MKVTTATMMMAVTIALAGCSDRPTGSLNPVVVDQPQTNAALAPKGAMQGFGFIGTLSGAPTGAVFLTGGGSFLASSASNTVPSETRVASGGGFRCTEAVAQGPLSGCGAGEGVRWDAVQLLVSSNFRCTGTDAVKSASTGVHIAVMVADFYRAGDGEGESFTAPMIVSETDIAPDLPGTQKLWIQGVGCGDASVQFNR